MQTEDGSIPSKTLRTACFSAANDISLEYTTLLDRQTTPNPNPEDSIDSAGFPLAQLLFRQATQLLLLFSPESIQDKEVPDYPRRVSLLLKRLDDILTASYTRFYAYIFRDLPVFWRKLYTDASILKFSTLFLSWGGDGQSGARLDDMVKALDLALILAGGAGDGRGRRWINGAFVMLEEVCGSSQYCLSSLPGSDLEAIAGRSAKRAKRSPSATTGEGGEENPWVTTPSFSCREPFTPPVTHPVSRTGPLSLSAFQTHLNNASGPSPLVLTGLTEEWPARTTRPWDRPEYLLSRTFGGRRLVPVEIGRSYVDEGWTQKLIALKELVGRYIDVDPASESTTPKGYLAQHPLFTQFPSLLSDIITPDYVYTSPPLHPLSPTLTQPELDTPQLNAWFGPPGTITPLHTDPYHNLLVQVVGRKYIRLYPPHPSDLVPNGRMRPRGREGGVEMGNTSHFDVGLLEGWDPPLLSNPSLAPHERQPGNSSHSHENASYETPSPKKEEIDEEEKVRQKHFQDLQYLDCILEPGDTLYIPIGWWHYVRGLSVSFSVSFWWN